MLRIRDSLTNDSKLSPATANNYVRNLYMLNGKKPYTTLAFLRKKADVFQLLGTYAPSTQSAMLGAVVGVLALFKDRATFKTLHTYYTKEMQRRMKALACKNGEMTEKQKDNWISWEEVKKKKEELGADLPVGKKRVLDAAHYNPMFQYVVLGLYTDVPPRRNLDYTNMFIVKKWNEKMPTDRNYYDTTNKKFVFNNYKTAGKYGQQIEDIPVALQDKLNRLVKYHPLWRGTAMRGAVPLLVDSAGERLPEPNGMTRVMNRIFGKRIGVSMLRHIFLTEKFGAHICGLSETATAMGHSAGTALTYIKDTPEANQNTLSLQSRSE